MATSLFGQMVFRKLLLLTLVAFSNCSVKLHPISAISVSCPATLAGHWDCGHQIGLQFRKQIIAAMDDESLQDLYKEMAHGGIVRTVFQAMKATAIKTYPYYVQELNGTACAAGLPLDLVLLSNFQQEIGMARGSALAKATPDRCSDAFTDTAFAHNEDGGIGDFDTIYFVRLRTYTENGETVDEFAGITYAGRLPGWGPGWNHHQLAWTSNVLYAKPVVPALDGVSVIFVSRDMARASSIEDAIARGTPKGLMAGQNLNIGCFRERRVVTVETAPGGTWNKLEVTRDVSPTFHANEYLRMKDVPQDEDNAHLTSARHRHAAFLRTNPPQNKTDLLNFLGDTSDTVFPVFRRNDTTQEFTLVTVAFDLLSGTAEFYRANPRLGGQALLWRDWILPKSHTYHTII